MEKKKYLKFKGKIGLVVPIVYLILCSGIVLLWTLPYQQPVLVDALTSKIMITCVLGLLLIIFTWAVFSTYYVLTDDFLTVVSGPIRTHVLYSHITEVKPSHSIWSVSALSFNRVAIKRGKSIFTTLLVSPKQKELFMEELNKRIKNRGANE